jgi:hypothetical protein
MPLNLSALQSGLEGVASKPPASTAEAAQRWADAVLAYATAVLPLSSTVQAAAATLAGGLAGAFSAPAAAPGMESAFAAFGASVGLGMAGYTPAPPAVPVGFAQVFATNRGSAAEGAQAVASAIDSWMRTGLSTLVAPPNTAVPWS